MGWDGLLLFLVVAAGGEGGREKDFVSLCPHNPTPTPPSATNLCFYGISRAAIFWGGEGGRREDGSGDELSQTINSYIQNFFLAKEQSCLAKNLADFVACHVQVTYCTVVYYAN